MVERAELAVELNKMAMGIDEQMQHAASAAAPAAPACLHAPVTHAYAHAHARAGTGTRDTNTDGMIDFMGLGVATSRLGRLSRLICTHRHVSGFKLCLRAQTRVAAMCAHP